MMRISPWRKPLALCPLVLLLALGALSVAQAQSDSRMIAALGRIVPGEGVVNVAAPTGEAGQAIVAELKVQPGQEVKQGDALAVLTTLPLLQAAVTAAEKDAAAAQAQADAAKAGVAVAQKQLATYTAQLQSHDARVSAAKKDASAAQMDVDTAQKAMARAQAEYQAAVDRLQGEIDEQTRLIREWDPGTKDRVQLQSKQRILALEIKKLGATKASQDNELKATYNAAQAQADAAASQVDVVASERQSILDQQAIAEAQLAQAQKEAESVAAQAAAAQAGVAQAQARLAMATVTAPINGVVVGINAWPGEAVEPGGVVALADTSQMYVVAEVYVDEVSKVKVGQSVIVTGQPLDGELAGKVDRVSMQVAANIILSRDPTAYADQRVVKVRVKLDDPAAVRSLIGAQVTVKIKP